MQPRTPSDCRVHSEPQALNRLDTDSDFQPCTSLPRSTTMTLKTWLPRLEQTKVTRLERFTALRARWRQRATRLRTWIRRRLDALQPTAATARWIGYAATAAVVGAGAWIGATMFQLRLGSLADAVAGALLAGLLLVLARLSVSLLRGTLTVLLRHGTPIGFAAALVLVVLALPSGLPPALALPVGLGLGLAIIVIGASTALLRRRPLLAFAGGVPSLLLLAAVAAWLIGDGAGDDPTRALIRTPTHPGQAYAGLLERGPYPVEQLSYGSGTDRRRPEFADDAAWTSATVDARRMLGQPDGWFVRLRERWWRFGLDSVPLNGRVWYPEGGSGPLPLVLVVHGNHDMMRWSDPGYAWLGEHLASRGHIVVSVDQNFFNGGPFGNLKRENAARGWLLLEHLRAWRDWQTNPTHPLHERAALDRVVLIGHSRGGEAVALAAAFNRLPAFPEDARQGFDYGFGLRGIAAIAPVDGQFWASEKPTVITGSNYFVLHGGYDADVSSFVGDRQYVRAEPDPQRGGFRAALYLHHANHGQFNTGWNADARGPALRLLNQAALMSGDEQRRAALLYLTAFVETSVAADARMPALFCDAESAGTLLPPTLYVNRCDDGRRLLLADFEHDLDLTTGNIDGLRLDGEHLALWHEKDIGLRGNPPRRQTGVWLGWRARQDAVPAYRLSWPAGTLPLSDAAVLWLDIAQADRDPPKDDTTDSASDRRDDAAEVDYDHDDDRKQASSLRAPLVITIELQDATGRRVQRPLSDFAQLPPPLPVRHTRLRWLDRMRYQRATEPLLQSVAVPLAAFADAGLDIDSVHTMRLLFDTEHAGVLIIERIALQPDPAFSEFSSEFDPD